MWKNVNDIEGNKNCGFKPNDSVVTMNNIKVNQTLSFMKFMLKSINVKRNLDRAFLISLRE